MVAEIQRLENAARLAMGEFQPPEPLSHGRGRFAARPTRAWTLALTVGVAIAVVVAVAGLLQ